MPPKRKRSDETTAPAAAGQQRATRSSARLSNGDSTAGDAAVATKASAKTAGKKGGMKGATAATANGHADGKAELETSEPSSKKAKPSPKGKGKGKAKPKTSTGKAAKAIAGADDESDIASEDTKPGPSKATKAKPKASANQNGNNNSSGKSEPFTPARCGQLFAAYADEDDPEVIGPESFQRLCQAAGAEMEGSRPLILAWLVDSKEMGRITKDEWMHGMGTLQISTLTTLSLALTEFDDLLVQCKPALAPPSPAKKGQQPPKSREPYSRARYYEAARDVEGTFGRLYAYCFGMARGSAASRSIDMDIATAFWSVLLGPQYPLIADVLVFITEKKGTYKGVNKDLWGMMLEFCQTVKPTGKGLEGYDEEGAWPTMIDDFVAWKIGGGAGES